MDGAVSASQIALRSEPSGDAPFDCVLSSFHRRGINYCYWRSRRRIEAAWTGQSDLDLLISKRDQYRAEESLLEAGFKCFPAIREDHPAISSFLCHDEASGRIVHVHLHVRLVIGGALLKTHRLPWEDALLARGVWHPSLPIRVLDPADEALLILVREFLELRRTDPVILRRRSEMARRLAADRLAAVDCTDRLTLLDRARELFPDGLAATITAAAVGESTPAARRRLSRQVRKNLTSWRLSGALEQHARTAGRTVSWALAQLNLRCLHLTRPWRRRAPGGGCVIALVGVDGSGKTTAMTGIKAWMGPEVDAMTIYFGTGGGRPSILLLPLKLVLPLVMAFFRSKPKGSSHGQVSDRQPGPAYGVLMMIWAGVLAAEKRIKLVAARRGAERGLVIIADRYPQDEDPAYNDGPLLPRLRHVPRWLRAFEERSYALARRLPPDLVIKLDVSPETAARREPEMDPGVIRTRIPAMRRLEFPGAKVVCIDAEQPLAAVLSAVKREIWRML